MAIALFAASSLVAVMRAEIFDGAFGLLALFIDTVFFMLLAKYGANQTLWFTPVFYLYLLTAAIALYSPREVVLVSGVCILLSLTTYPGSAQVFRATIVVCGVFASAFSFQKKWLEKRVETLTEERALAGGPKPCETGPADCGGLMMAAAELHQYRCVWRSSAESSARPGSRLELQQLQCCRRPRDALCAMAATDVDEKATAATRRHQGNFRSETGYLVTLWWRASRASPRKSPPTSSDDARAGYVAAFNATRWRWRLRTDGRYRSTTTASAFICDFHTDELDPLEARPSAPRPLAQRRVASRSTGSRVGLK
jgi:hypothetical protein